MVSELEMEAALAKRILYVIELALPNGTMEEKARTAVIVLDVLSRIPMSEFSALGSVIQDFKIMTEKNQNNVLSYIRGILTKLRIR